jgi:hypothetical protein
VTFCSMSCSSGYTAKSTENTPAAWPPAARNAAPSPTKKSESLAYSRFLSTRCNTEPATSDRPPRPPPRHFERSRPTLFLPASLLRSLWLRIRPLRRSRAAVFQRTRVPPPRDHRGEQRNQSCNCSQGLWVAPAQDCSRHDEQQHGYHECNRHPAQCLQFLGLLTTR